MGNATRRTRAITECAYDVQSCVAAVGEFGDVVIWNRECGQGSDNKCSEMELGDATATVCSCLEDLCNYATPVLASPPVVLVALLTAGLLNLVRAAESRER